MKNKPKEPPRIAVKFANMVFVLGILYSVLLIVYAIYKIYNPPGPVSPAFYIISILSCGVFATLFGFGLKRLNNNLKVNLSVLFFTIGIAVYGFEIYLESRYDTRTKMEVLDDLRDSGVEAYPNIVPGYLINSNGLTTKKGRIYPLGTISNSTTILGNESGYYPIIETDEHGFNNPKGLYNKNKVDIILTGDSFAEGYTVHQNESIGAVLRQLDFNAISIGKGGNGSLIELATLKEYAEPLKPKIVLWVYFVNDLNDLEVEMQSSILKKYLNEDDYSQNLISRQEEIDAVLINYAQVEWEKEKNKEKERVENNTNWTTNTNEVIINKIINNRIIRILKLNKLRRMINLRPTPTPTPAPTPIFVDILQKSKQMVSDWDGKMYFVYLPEFARYSIGNEDPNRDFVLRTATELDIPIIDIHKEVFDPHPDPLSLFPFRIGHHYTAEGYKLVVEAIGKRLEADGYVPIKSRKQGNSYRKVADQITKSTRKTFPVSWVFKILNREGVHA